MSGISLKKEMRIGVKYKIAVCDDREADRKYVMDKVSRWAEKTYREVHMNAFISAEDFLFHYEEEKDYDVLLLDIENRQFVPERIRGQIFVV